MFSALLPVADIPGPCRPVAPMGRLILPWRQNAWNRHSFIRRSRFFALSKFFAWSSPIGAISFAEARSAPSKSVPMTVTPVKSAPPSWALLREAPVRSAPFSEANSRSTRDKSAPRAFSRSRLADFSTARMRPIDWLRMSAPKCASAIEAPTRLAPVRSAATRACERSAPSSRARSICEANRFAPFRLAPVRSAWSSHAWSRIVRSSFAPASLVLLNRAVRNIAPDRSSPERLRPDNLFPVKSAGAARVAVASAASISPRVISAETISGDDRSTWRSMSCAVAVMAIRPRLSATVPTVRFIVNSADDVFEHSTQTPAYCALAVKVPMPERGIYWFEKTSDELFPRQASFSYNSTARTLTSRRHAMTPARSMRLVVCALAALGATAIVARADDVNDYPTAARSEYVFGCLKANGETRQSIDQCSCSIDVIASLLPYDRYVTAETVLSMAQVRGNLGTQFRSSEQATSALNDLRRAQAEAEVRCF